MESRASVKNIRVSPRKARLVADLVRGKDVNDAIQTLTLVQKKTAIIFKKLIESAVANATQGKVVDPDNLFVKTILVDKGPFLKRYVPRAQGRATEVRKKLSHINVVLDER